MNGKTYFVYILASKKNGTLYTGVTSDLIKRIWQHKNELVPSFTQQYKVHMLVYFELFSDPETAIIREKYLKGKRRSYKIDLVEKRNPQWTDLYPTIIR